MQFGVANTLQEKINCEFNGIISSNEKLKDFYQKQNFVKFENLWVYPDSIKNSDVDPDMDYLLNFEKKYEISLWEIIYSERIFSNEYNKYHKFSKNELLLILEQACKFFESIFENIHPDVVITKLPIGHDDYLFYKLCLAKKIKILFIRKSRLGNRAYIVDNYEKSISTISKQKNFKTFEELQLFVENYSSYEQIKSNRNIVQSHKSSKIMPFLKFYLGFTKTSSHFLTLGKNQLNLTRFDSKFFRNLGVRKQQSYLNKFYVTELDESTSFIFFPLHYEPERSLLIDNRFFSNQFHIIECILKSIPINFQLYVKEHPRMIQKNNRKLSFYKKIIDLPNVKLLSPHLDPKIIFKKCKMVITISGSAGLEATFYNKPAITFTTEKLSLPSSLIKIENPKDLPNAIKVALKTKPDLQEVSQFINELINESFDFDIFQFDNEFNKKFPYLGFLNTSPVLSTEVEKFLSEYKGEFEKLTIEHLKKINFDSESDY
jgi:hypothetical protein